MVQPIPNMQQRTTDAALSPQQQLGAIAKPHLQEQLRTVFETYESLLLTEPSNVRVCAELRRSRRGFIDGMVKQWLARCEVHDREWVIGSAANAAHTRTFIYLTLADQQVHELYLEQAVDIGRIVAGWGNYVGIATDSFTCPLAPHTLARLFFLFLPELPAPLHVRYGLAQTFLQQLPTLSLMIQRSAYAFWQRIGLSASTLSPVPLPEYWEPLERYRTPSVAAQALVAPPRTADRVAAVADDIARAALAGDMDDALSLLSAYRQTALMPWLATQLSAAELPAPALEVLLLLAGPLVMASMDEHFADAAHPARRVLDELMNWVPGWAGDEASESGGLAGQCLQGARYLSSTLVQLGEEGQHALHPSYWLDLLEHLVGTRRHSQSDGSLAVASARLSVQVMEVRAEVEALMQERGLAFSPLPAVVVEILTETWVALLMAIHWQDGTASDAWLSAVSVADELLTSVQPSLDRQGRLQSMQRVPHLLQQLRRGFDMVHADRKSYSAYLDRLERVHLSLMQDRPSPEPLIEWPQPLFPPAHDEPFESGQWLQEENGLRWRVVFSDDLCTVLVNTNTVGLVCCSTAALQAQLFNAELHILPSPPALLPNSLSG